MQPASLCHAAIAGATLLGGLAAPSLAQTFNFPSFPNATGLALNGTASVTGGALQLNPNLGDQYGSAYYATPVPVTEVLGPDGSMY